MRSAINWLCLSSTASLDCLIRSSTAGSFKGSPENLDILQNRENLSSAIFVDQANLRAAIAGLQSAWSNGTTKSLGSLQGAPWQLLCTLCPVACSRGHFKAWRGTAWELTQKNWDNQRNTYSVLLEMAHSQENWLIARKSHFRLCGGAAAQRAFCTESDANFKFSREWQTPAN